MDASPCSTGSPTSPTHRSARPSSVTAQRPVARWRSPRSKCERRLTAAYGSADDVAVELRGAGPATRQVNNFMSPEAWPDADKLMCVELITPDGNWSSYPPHRHDDSPECPVNNEEIYYFRIGVAGSSDYSADGFRHAPHVHARRFDRRQRRGSRRRCVLRATRLSRPVHRRTRLPDVLPQRARRPGRRAVDGVLRRPDAPLGPRHMGRHGHRSAVPDDDEGWTNTREQDDYESV